MTPDDLSGLPRAAPCRHSRPADTLLDLWRQMRWLRSWREDGIVRLDHLDDRLVAGVVIDLEKLDNAQRGISRAAADNITGRLTR